MKAHWTKYTLNFKQPAGTSRGTLRTKDTWFLHLNGNEQHVVGECGMFRGLSYDDRPGYEDKLQEVCDQINAGAHTSQIDLTEWPSIQMGLDCALKLLHHKTPHKLYENAFARGKADIPINGLIWMGDKQFMMDQIHAKLEEGYRCLKMKIGAIDFKAELDLLDFIRSRFRESELTLRVDANGAFSPSEALEKLNRLAQFDLHSIEQPIKAGQVQEMARLCEDTPIPIALDEELIGVIDRQKQRALLDSINPHYIILKPTLVGGLSGSSRWIKEADKRGIAWWITSALESNVGLNAIAQYTYQQDVSMPQGLGTGSLFTNQIEAPLTAHAGYLKYEPSGTWQQIP